MADLDSALSSGLAVAPLFSIMSTEAPGDLSSSSLTSPWQGMCGLACIRVSATRGDVFTVSPSLPWKPLSPSPGRSFVDSYAKSSTIISSSGGAFLPILTTRLADPVAPAADPVT